MGRMKILVALSGGIDSSVVAHLLAEQGHCCALCGTDTPDGKGAWHIDHNHKTGDIRGILCHSCNTRLGTYERFEADVGRDKIIKYLATVRVPKAATNVERRRYIKAPKEGRIPWWQQVEVDDDSSVQRARQ